MRVRITAKAGYTNPRRGIDLPLGAEANVPDDLAVKLMNNLLAEPAPQPAVKTAAVAPPENAAKSIAKPKASKSSRPAKEEAE